MRRSMRLVLTGALLACSLSLIAAGNGKRITYSVDAGTANPTATVTKNGQGLTVVVFKAADLDAGGTFTFTASLGVKGKHITFPVEVNLAATSQSGLTVTFDPAAVTFLDGTTPQTAVVTVTLAPGSYSQHRIKTTIKAEPASGSGLGLGPGIKVIIAKQSSPVATTSEERILQDVRDALAP